jgi:hypothetical protein
MRTPTTRHSFTNNFTSRFTIEGFKEQKMPKIKKQQTVLEDKDLQNEWIAMTERVEELEYENTQMTGVIGYLEFQLQQTKDKNE